MTVHVGVERDGRAIDTCVGAMSARIECEFYFYSVPAQDKHSDSIAVFKLYFQFKRAFHDFIYLFLFVCRISRNLFRDDAWTARCVSAETIRCRVHTIEWGGQIVNIIDQVF